MIREIKADEYSKPPTSERVLSQEYDHKSNLFPGPLKLAY